MKSAKTILFAWVALAGGGWLMAGENAGPSGQTPEGVVQKAGSVATASAASATNYPVIGYLERRGQTITIKAGPKGPLYSVKTSEGKVLGENLSPEQLRAQAPEVSEFLKSAVAGGAGEKGARLDARVRPIADARLR